MTSTNSKRQNDNATKYNDNWLTREQTASKKSQKKSDFSNQNEETKHFYDDTIYDTLSIFFEDE